MNVKISKTNERVVFFNALLDEVRMSGHERLRAKAALARAEAFADALAAVFNFAKQLLKALVLRPYRRLTTPFG